MSFFARIFGKRNGESSNRSSRIFFTNTLSGNKELFISQKPNLVTMYSCGPTVYGPALIGNLRAYVFSDTIARTLTAAGVATYKSRFTDGGEANLTGIVRMVFAIFSPVNAATFTNGGPV